MEELLLRLSLNTFDNGKNIEDLNARDWECMKGVLLSRNEAKFVLDALKDYRKTADMSNLSKFGWDYKHDIYDIYSKKMGFYEIDVSNNLGDKNWFVSLIELNKDREDVVVIHCNATFDWVSRLEYVLQMGVQED